MKGVALIMRSLLPFVYLGKKRLSRIDRIPLPLLSSRLHCRLFSSSSNLPRSNQRPFARPNPNITPKRIIFGSCSSQKEDLSYWDQISALSPDLVILMGDNVYGRKVGLPQAYATLGQHESFQKAAQTIPIIATLDDNDYECHPAGMDAAKNLFLDFFQAPADDTRREPNRGVYNSYVWATDQLQLICLDVRYCKSPFLQAGDENEQGPYIPEYNKSANCTMLGPQQWKWLEEQLRVDVKLRLICSPIQVLAEGHGWDCWNLMPHERDRLLHLLTKSQNASKSPSSKTLILTGDRHVGAFYQKNELFEITSSSLTHSVPSGLLDHEYDPTRIGNFVHVNNFGMIDWKLDGIDGLAAAGSTSPLLEVSIRRADNGQVVDEAWSRCV